MAITVERASGEQPVAFFRIPLEAAQWLADALIHFTARETIRIGRRY